MATNPNSDMAKYSRMMERKAPRQFGFAMRSTLNTLASASRYNATTVGTQKLTKRSSYINKTIQFENAKGSNIDTMQSSFGQVSRMYGKEAGQLSVHETGGDIKPSRGSSRLRKPTRAGRSGSFKRPVRKKIAQSRFMNSRKFYSNVARGRRPKTQRGRMIGMLAWARRVGFPGFIVGRSPQKRTLGAYKASGRGTQIRMIYNFEDQKTTVRAMHWMERSYRDPIKRRQAILNNNLKKQITRMKRMTGL